MDGKAQPVDVICVCTTEGDIRPLRLRLSESGQSLRVDIDQILQVDNNLRFGAETITFVCGATVFQHRIKFSLKYCVQSRRWSIIYMS